MYKKFALFVLLLAPILAMMANAFMPSADAPVQPSVVGAPSSEDAVVQERTGPVSPPMASPPMTSAPPHANFEGATDAPMLDPVGVDPTPVAVDTVSATQDVPVVGESKPADDT